MALARRTFDADNRYGVHAFGLGPQIRGGHPLRRIVLNVYVARKTRRPVAPIPRLVLRRTHPGFRVPTNVIATGCSPHAAVGVGSYSGIHAGAAVSVRGTMPGWGAIAALLTPDRQPTHALTAGHLFPPGSDGAAVFAAPDDNSVPTVVAHLQANFLDGDGVDAALLELTNAGVSMASRDGPPLGDWLDGDSVWSKIGCAFLATSNDYSRQTTTGAAPMDALLYAPTRGNYWVRGGVSTAGEVTNPGDSGTVFCTGASNDLALGICSGALGAHSVFEIFDRPMRLARARINGSLTLY